LAPLYIVKLLSVGPHEFVLASKSSHDAAEPSKPGLFRTFVLLFGWQMQNPLEHCLPFGHPPQQARFEMQPLLQICCPEGQVVAQAGAPDWQPKLHVEALPGLQLPLPSQVGAA
jgi:hypothetical protein